MPSGPKKRRAERKKNDTISKTATNPASHTHEETMVAAVDTKTIETPMMVDVYEHMKKTEKTSKETESVDDKIILTDTNTKKSETNESEVHDQPAIVNPPVNKDIVQDLSLEPHDLSFLDSRVSIDASNFYDKPAMVKPDDSVSSKEVQDILKEPLKSNIVDPPATKMKLLEQLSGISAEMGFHAEKQVSLAKELKRVLEELKFGKLK